MKGFVLKLGGITLLVIILWWVITWIANGGWPTAGPVMDTLPPHIQYVTPADGERVEETYGFCLHFYYQAGHGMGDEPQQTIRYFIDGKNVTKQVLDIVTLTYGYPDPVGEPCYRQTEPFASRWHTVKVIYADQAGEDFQYMWRFQVVNE